MEKYGTDEQFYISDIDYGDTRYTATIALLHMGGQELSGKRHLGHFDLDRAVKQYRRVVRRIK